MRWSGKFFRPGQSGTPGEMFQNLDPGFSGHASLRLHRQPIMMDGPPLHKMTSEDWSYLQHEREAWEHTRIEKLNRKRNELTSRLP